MVHINRALDLSQGRCHIEFYWEENKPVSLQRVNWHWHVKSIELTVSLIVSFSFPSKLNVALP